MRTRCAGCQFDPATARRHNPPFKPQPTAQGAPLRGCSYKENLSHGHPPRYEPERPQDR